MNIKKMLIGNQEHKKLKIERKINIICTNNFKKKMID